MDLKRWVVPTVEPRAKAEKETKSEEVRLQPVRSYGAQNMDPDKASIVPGENLQIDLRLRIVKTDIGSIKPWTFIRLSSQKNI